MTWKEFETFVIDLLNSLYHGQGISIVKTPYQGDGGKDGYANLIIGPKDEEALAFMYRLWIEVKKRQVDALDEGDIGGHMILALDELVNKLIFVTNTRFTERVVTKCKRVGRRYNLAVAFIDGHELLRLKQCVNGSMDVESHNGREGDSGRNDLLADSLTRVDTRLDFRAGFVRNLEEELPSRPLDLSVDVGEVAYWLMEIEGYLDGPERFARIESVCRSGCNMCAVPVSAPVISISSIDSFQRLAFAVWASDVAGTYSASDMGITFGSDALNWQHLVESHGGRLSVRSPVLLPTLPPERARLVNDVSRAVTGVAERGNIHCEILEAEGGCGKSFITQHLRHHWLQHGVREIRLDGSIHSRVPRIVRSILRQALPLDEFPVSDASAEAVVEWCKRGGVPGKLAKQIAGRLGTALGRQQFGLSDEEAAMLMGRVLAAVSGTRTVVVLFEDLHKVTAAGLQLLQDSLGFLYANRQGNVAFVLTTRPFASEGNMTFREQWRKQLISLYSDSRVVTRRVKPLTSEDAKELLLSSIQSLRPYEANEIIQQVGTNPFFLKEAVLLLKGIGAVEFSSSLGHFVTDYALVRREIDLETLKEATKNRISHIVSEVGSWLEDFLVAAACLGDAFASELCLSVANDGLQDDIKCIS